MTMPAMYMSDEAYQRQCDASRKQKERKVNNDDFQSGVILDAEYVEIENDPKLLNHTSEGETK